MSVRSRERFPTNPGVDPEATCGSGRCVVCPESGHSQPGAELGRGLPCRARPGAEGPASGSGPLRTPDLPARLAAPLLEATWVEGRPAPPPRTRRMAALSPFSFPLLPVHDNSSPPPSHRSVQTFADKSKQEALKNDLVEALKRKQQC